MKKIIIKYPNRKLYDKTTKCYTNLDEIYNSVMLGDEIIVLDKKTGNDLTLETKLKIIKKQETLSNTPNHVLDLVIKNGLANTVSIGG